MAVHIGPGPLQPLRPSQAGPMQPSAVRPQPGGFQQVFEQALRPLKVSAHAQERLQQARRVLSESELERVRQGVEKAAAKGARESLVMLGDLALVVSVPNRTVITAVEKQRLQENVFTNIDSAVFV